jgi:primosomal protein N' (replication factor Y)
MMQVAGRAGRKHKKGKVVIQTSDPSHPVIQNVLHSDFKEMYETEIISRRQFQYPPFARMIEVTLKHKQVQTIEKAALYLANELRKTNTAQILGPAVPFVSKINNYYIREILIKSNRNTKDLGSMKLALQNVLDKMKTLAELKSVEVKVDVDP